MGRLTGGQPSHCGLDVVRNFAVLPHVREIVDLLLYLVCSTWLHITHDTCHDVQKTIAAHVCSRENLLVTNV